MTNKTNSGVRSFVGAILTGGGIAAFLACNQPLSPEEPVTSRLVITPGELVLTVKDSTTLEAVPYDRTGHVVDVPVTWSSRVPQVATVTTSGDVTALAVGESYAVATAGTYSDSVLVVVRPGSSTENDFVSLIPHTVTLTAGEKLDFTAITPVWNEPLVWSSSTEGIIALTAQSRAENDGIVTVVMRAEAIGRGTTELTVRAPSGIADAAIVTVQ